MNSKAQTYGEIPGIAMMFVLAALTGSLGVLILGKFRDSDNAATLYCEGGYELEGGSYEVCCLSGYTVNASDVSRCVNDTSPTSSNVSTAVGTLYSNFNQTADYGISGIKELLSWTDTVAIIFVAVILIAAIMLFGRSRRI